MIWSVIRNDPSDPAAPLRQNWLSNLLFKSYDDIVDHCCYAWNTLIDQPWKIMSIAATGP
jgi:hypothetical protein